MVNLYEILQKIGFDWQVALANLFNFLVILFLLKKFAFKPVGKLIKDRQDKISEGLQKAEEAGARLHEIDVIAKNILKKSQQESIDLINSARQKSKLLEESLAKNLEEKNKELLHQAELDYKKQQELAKQNIIKESGELIKKILIKTVELNPKDIDDALIAKAVSQIGKE